MKESTIICINIKAILHKWEPILVNLSAETISQPRNKQNRNIKQILGHMIDSASNNTHRIVYLQYQSSPMIFPNYATFGNNDRWIAIQNYENENWVDMVQLWKYSLHHICHVIENVNDNKLNNEWIAGPGEKISLRSMISGFPEHIELHLAEINELINIDQ